LRVICACDEIEKSREDCKAVSLGVLLVAICEAGQEGVNLILVDGVNIPIAELSLKPVKNILVSDYRIFFWEFAVW
jgi:hypothetical protein